MASLARRSVWKFGLLVIALILSTAAFLLSLYDPDTLLAGGVATWSIATALTVTGLLLLLRH